MRISGNHVTTCCFFAVLLLCAGCVRHSSPSTAGGIVLHFFIRPESVPDKSLSIKLSINKVNPGTDTFVLYKNMVVLSALSVTDGRGRHLSADDKNGALRISLRKAELPLTVSYTATIGQIGRHGHCGGLYGGLAVFDGDHALVLPGVDFNADAGRGIDSITIEYGFPAGRTALVPGASSTAKNDGRLMTRISNPGWMDLYHLVKSCYVFGSFERAVRTAGGTTYTVFADSSVDYSETTGAGIDALYRYYSALFGKTPSGFTAVVLRRDPADGAYIFGGFGPEMLATTFDAGKKRDWEKMSHRLFHLFFDANVPVPLFHRPPQLWFYEGLATYYESVACDSLPLSIRHDLALDAAESFRALFRRYVYRRIKDPHYALAPMAEGKISSSGEMEFLHYTQAPLLVKMMEDISFKKFHQHDRLIRFIIENANQISDLRPVIAYGVTDNPDAFAETYLFNNEIMPLWYLSSGRE